MNDCTHLWKFWEDPDGETGRTCRRCGAEYHHPEPDEDEEE
jgi:hypothetical protein